MGIISPFCPDIVVEVGGRATFGNPLFTDRLKINGAFPARCKKKAIKLAKITTKAFRAIAIKEIIWNNVRFKFVALLGHLMSFSF